MSGAASALAAFASANRRPGIMSALNLLSVIAPAIPNAPQGSSDEAASGFQGLLEAASGEAPGEREAKPGAAIGADADVDGALAAAAGFLIAPTPSPPPTSLPVVEEASAATGTNPAGSADGGPAPDPALPAPAVDASAPDGEQTTTPLPMDKSRAAKTGEPQVLPFIGGGMSLRPAAMQTAPQTRAQAQPQVQTAAPAVAETAAAAPAVAATEQVPAPVVPPAPVPSPAPLRPLAERTSRPLTESAAGDGARTADAPRSVTPAVSAPVPAPAGAGDLAARIVDPTVNAATDADDGAEADAPEFTQAGEAGTVSSQPASVTREVAVSQLSRTAVEATAQIAAQILRRLEGRSTRFEMALTPDELGRVDVKLDIDSEGRLNARLAFDNPAAAADLRGRADELRRLLEDAGFHLAADAFEFADRDSGSSAFDRGQDARHGSSRAFAAASRINADIDVAQPPAWLALSLSPSGVDMKV